MRILLTNDDGIYAKGIEVLAAHLRTIAQVTVVAPDHERSAAGHAITLWDPLRVSTVDRNGAFFGYAVDGTPADCVKIAIQRLLKPKPDLVVSGVNLGPNTGTNIIYSGTVSAALEGAVLGIPSMAISLATFRQPRFAVAARVARTLCLQLRQLRLPPEVVLNVNVPNRPLTQLKGVRVTCQSRSRWLETFDQRRDPRGRAYYWLKGGRRQRDPAPDSDEQAVRRGYVSVTPISIDLTSHKHLDALQGLQSKGSAL
ncbi:MAG: 5'/3'-nucleotidase SurE [Candidatus Omnitrophica bacterium]|nr:5'/3'-nucleotidase SurE [Candidatus Omnitrophota bacterium]